MNTITLCAMGLLIVASLSSGCRLRATPRVQDEATRLEVVYVEAEPIRIVGASTGSAAVVRDESPAAR